MRGFLLALISVLFSHASVGIEMVCPISFIETYYANAGSGGPCMDHLAVADVYSGMGYLIGSICPLEEYQIPGSQV